MLEKEAALERLAAYVQTIGYKAKIESGHIVSAMTGFRVLIFCNPTLMNIQLFAAFEASEKFGLPELNQYNLLWKYTKCTFRDNGGVAFEADYLIDLESENALRSLDQAIHIYEITLAAGTKALRGET